MTRTIIPPPPRRNKGNWKLRDHCSNPLCESYKTTKKMVLNSTILVKGQEIHIKCEKYRCTNCGQTFQSPEQGTKGVKTAVTVFLQRNGYMTTKALKKAYKTLKLDSTEELLNKLGYYLPPEEIELLESEVRIQSKASDKLIRKALNKLGYNNAL